MLLSHFYDEHGQTTWWFIFFHFSAGERIAYLMISKFPEAKIAIQIQILLFGHENNQNQAMPIYPLAFLQQECQHYNFNCKHFNGLPYYPGGERMELKKAFPFLLQNMNFNVEKPQSFQWRGMYRQDCCAHEALQEPLVKQDIRSGHLSSFLLLSQPVLGRPYYE